MVRLVPLYERFRFGRMMAPQTWNTVVQHPSLRSSSYTKAVSRKYSGTQPYWV